MTKSDIVQKVQKKLGVSPKTSADLVELVLEIMKRTFENGQDLKINGFGSFKVKQKKDRKGRNPQTTETIAIKARRVLTFKPSPILKRKVNLDI